MIRSHGHWVVGKNQETGVAKIRSFRIETLPKLLHDIRKNRPFILAVIQSVSAVCDALNKANTQAEFDNVLSEVEAATQKARMKRE